MATAVNLTTNALLPHWKQEVSVAVFTFLQTAVVIVPFGIVANILNIIVFFKTGARDNVTVSLLALSMSDLAFLVLMSPQVFASFLVGYLERQHGISIQWVIDPRIIIILSYWYAFVFNETSALITIYISVVRCACVALPFSVKSTFTSKRAIIAFLLFFISVVLLRIPTFMVKRVAVVFDKATNTSSLKYVQLDDGGLASNLSSIVNRNALPWVALIILVISVTILIYKLYTSAKFRSATTTSGSNSKTSKDVQGPSSDASSETAQTSKQRGQTLSSREVRAVRSVVLVASVFLTCQVAFVVSSLGLLLDPEFNDSPTAKRYNIYLVSASLNSILGYINASVNIFVYYTFNSRYRQCMDDLFRPTHRKLI